MRMVQVLIVLSGFLAVTQGSGQDLRSERIAGTCASCEVRLQLNVTFEGKLLDAPSTLVYDGERYLVSSRLSGKAILIFDGQGRFVRRIGTIETVPGQSRGISALRIGADETLHVFDRQGNR